MKKIKVIQLIDSLAIGGAEVLAVNSCNLFNKFDKIESFLCVTRKEGPLLDKVDTNKYIFLNRSSRLDIKAVWKLVKFIKKHDIQIIHAHSTSFFVAFCVKIILFRVKIVWHDHFGNSEYLEKRNVNPLNFISLFFSAIIVVNSKLLNWSIKNLHTRRVHHVNNFAYLNNSKVITKLMGVDNKRIVILAALRPQKDHLNILNAFKDIVDKKKDWTLHIVGSGIGDAYEEMMYEFVNINRLNKSVYFYGGCNDIQPILAQATIAVLSSNSEGLPLALLEYGLAKLPVVITNVGECEKVVKNNYNGIIVPAMDSKILRKGLLSLIESKKKRILYGDLLYNEISNNYSKENYLNNLYSIYLTSI
ncbi:glycosyltransferase [Flavicella sp.]|uniref:glycosyltransferase n=1 Tax=Flavicella sp. TaxID=2957742 RepID=UPI0030177120